MRVLVVGAVLVALSAGPAAARVSKTVNVTAAANGQTIVLVTGDKLRVSMPSNPTTGYRWLVVTDARAILVPRGSTFVASTKRVGSGGVQTLAFRAGKAGTTKLVIVYEQSGSKKIAGRFHLSVRVKS